MLIKNQSGEEVVRKVAARVGVGIQTKEQISKERALGHLMGIIAEQYANLAKAKEWVKQGQPPIDPKDLVRFARQDLKSRLAELKKLDLAAYKILSKLP